MTVTLDFLKGLPVHGPAPFESRGEAIGPGLEDAEESKDLQGRTVSCETSEASSLFSELWERSSSWSLVLPGAVFYQICRPGNTVGLDLKTITVFILTCLLFKASSTRHKEELQRARAIERAVIRAEHRARVHRAFLNKAEQIAREESSHDQDSSRVIGTGSVMAVSGLSVYPIFVFPLALGS